MSFAETDEPGVYGFQPNLLERTFSSISNPKMKKKHTDDESEYYLKVTEIAEKIKRVSPSAKNKSKHKKTTFGRFRPKTPVSKTSAPTKPKSNSKDDNRSHGPGVSASLNKSDRRTKYDNMKSAKSSFDGDFETTRRRGQDDSESLFSLNSAKTGNSNGSSSSSTGNSDSGKVSISGRSDRSRFTSAESSAYGNELQHDELPQEMDDFLKAYNVAPTQSTPTKINNSSVSNTVVSITNLPNPTLKLSKKNMKKQYKESRQEAVETMSVMSDRLDQDEVKSNVEESVLVRNKKKHLEDDFAGESEDEHENLGLNIDRDINQLNMYENLVKPSSTISQPSQSQLTSAQRSKVDEYSVKMDLDPEVIRSSLNKIENPDDHDGQHSGSKREKFAKRSNINKTLKGCVVS